MLSGCLPGFQQVEPDPPQCLLIRPCSCPAPPSPVDSSAPVAEFLLSSTDLVFNCYSLLLTNINIFSELCNQTRKEVGHRADMSQQQSLAWSNAYISGLLALLQPRQRQGMCKGPEVEGASTLEEQLEQNEPGKREPENQRRGGLEGGPP